MRSTLVQLSSNLTISFPAPHQWDELYRSGQLPYTVASSVTIAEAVALIEALPAIRGYRGGLPIGYGLAPPLGVEPLVRIRKRLIDPYGVEVPARSKGVLGALWNESGRPVWRLWFRGLEQPGHAGKAVRGPCDVRQDAIAGIQGIGGKLPRLTGWEVVRLDHGAPEIVGEVRPGLLDAHGRPYADANPEGSGGSDYATFAHGERKNRHLLK